MHPFVERGAYKKHFNCTYKFPEDSEYNKNLLIPDKSDSVRLKVRLQSMYIRRLFATKAWILRIEILKDDFDFRRDIKRPQLKFQWKFSPNVILDKKSGKEFISCVGENCVSSKKMFKSTVNNLDESMFNVTNVDFN